MAENRKRDEIRLSDHFTYGRLIRFTLPSIAMMIFTSIYGVVDGIFVSNFVGETPFAALNLIMPYIMIFSAVGRFCSMSLSGVLSIPRRKAVLPMRKACITSC